jgi:F-type H+-transporting ATPase subunit b
MRCNKKARFVLISLTIFLGIILAPTASFASADAGEHEKCIEEIAKKVEAKEITDAEVKKETEDCFSAPSPILPAINEVIWGSAAFLIVAFGLMKFGFPAVKKGLADREAKIRGDLESAENSMQEAADKAAEYDAKLADARVEAAKIIEEAKEQAAVVKAELVKKAEADAAQIREKANVDAQSTATRAMDDIQNQVAALSVDLAEKLIKKNLDPKTQLELVNSYIADLSKN